MPTGPKILIACSQNWDSLAEVPYIFHKAGCIVDVCCSKYSWLLKNSFHHNWIEAGELEEYVSSVTEIAKSGLYDWIVLGDEPLLKKFSEEIDTQELFIKILPLTNIESRRLVASKNGLVELCSQFNLLSPKTLAFTKGADLSFLLESLNLPVLLKEDFSWGGNGIRFCNDLNTLKGELATLARDHPFVVQEYITGKDIAGEALFKEGKLVTFQCAEVLQYQTNKFGATFSRKYFESAEVRTIVEDIGHKIGINGFASMQFIRKDADQKYYLIEVDLRPQAWFRYGEFTGNNFSTGVRIFTGQLPLLELTEAPQPDHRSIKVVLFYRFLMSVMISKKIFSILQFFSNRNNWRYVPLYDRVLLKFMVRDVFTILKNRALKRIYLTKSSKQIAAS